MSGRVALVTGGSRGIGAAIVKSLAGRGFKVAVNCVKNAELAQKVLMECAGDGAVFQADARDHAQVAAMVKAVGEKLGPVDVAIHNANISFPVGPFHLMRWEEIMAKLSGEMGAFHALCAASVPGMIQRKWGRVVAVSSSLSRFAGEAFGAHAAAKSALDGACRVLSRELGPSGITVNVVAPGLVETDATAHQPAEMKQAIARATPLKRIGQPDDIGGVVAFLCSDEARWITGQYIPLNGGIDTV